MKIRSVLHVIMGTFLLRRGAVYAREKEDAWMVLVASKGFKRLPKRLEATDGETGSAEDLLEKAGAEVIVPLVAGEKVMGVLALGGRFVEGPYSTEQRELLRVVADQIAITLHNHSLFTDLSEKLDENRKLYEEMRLIYHDTIQAFAAAIDAKDPYTRNHSHRVAKYVVAIARELGWNDSDVEGIYIAGLLHDVGKIVLSDTILKKESTLTGAEMSEIRRHPNLSYDILSKVNFPWKDIVFYIRHHHERLDGSGYPDALDSKGLSDGAKILTLADSFDAMTTDRPYRRGMDLASALVELRRCLSTQFDSKIMAAFCRVLEKEINGRLPEANILPHINQDFDPSVITMMLEAITSELSTKS